MDSNHPRKPGTAFEYFLYAAIVAETGLAAIIYKTVFRSPDMAGLRAYFAIFYFAFLAWAIAQLNMLHRDRKAAVEEPAPGSLGEADEASDPTCAVSRRGTLTAHTRPVLGLTSAQLVILVVVFATAVATFSWALKLFL
jgi:uncharacterized membrane protein